jgi:AAA family ATP:ADP antiporter
LSASAPTANADFDRARLTWLERVLRTFTDVRPGEGATALLMFANVFLILCAYYFIKPLREGWLSASGTGGLSKLELRAYTAFGQSLLLIPVLAYYGRLVGRWPRAVLIQRATLFCMANMIAFWALQPKFLFENPPGIGVLFYLWVGIFSVFVVAQFWAFAADLYTEERGNRLLPLMRIADRREGVVAEKSKIALPNADRRGALELVFRTRYLLMVGLVMLLANWVKTNGENQLYDVVQKTLEGDAAAQGIVAADAAKHFVKEQTTAFYGSFFFWVNVAALALQAIFASRILKYGGFGALFLMLPVIALISYSAMALLPLLWVVKSLQIPVNATDYSIQNTARHVLWLPMSQEVTFKGKPTVDSLFMRAGDGMAAVTVLVGVQLASASRMFFVWNIALVIAWLLTAVWVVRRHRRLTEQSHAPHGSRG